MRDYPTYPVAPPPAPFATASPPLQGTNEPRPPSRAPKLFALSIVLLAVLLLSLPYLAEQVQFAITRGKQQAEAEFARAQLLDMPKNPGSYRLVVKAVRPCVVDVNTTRTVRDPGDELSFRFGRAPGLRAEGQGSGVIVDEEGYIITNYHVIEDATDIVVTLSDGRTIDDVEVVGSDPPTDVAVLKIDSGGLIAAPWGDSDRLEVGDPVLAIGSPFGLTRSVTAGIISAKGRQGIIDGLSYEDFLQTDAAVNPGNSGGPLVDMKGRVVGINTAIVGRKYQGISFAIPSGLVQDVYERLKANGKIVRGWLGVSMQKLDESLAARFDLEDADGVLVAAVLRGTPAEAAGIEPGDAIVSWNGESIDVPKDLSRAVAGTEVGSEATLVVIRDGKQRTFTVTVGKRPRQLR